MIKVLHINKKAVLSFSHRFPVILTGFVQTFSILSHRSDGLMESTGDNVCLLFRSQFDEVYCVAGYTDRQLRIVLRMLLGVQ